MAVPLRKKDRYVGLLLMWIWHNTSFIFNANPIKHPWTLKMKHCNLGSTFHPPTVYQLTTIRKHEFIIQVQFGGRIIR